MKRRIPLFQPRSVQKNERDRRYQTNAWKKASEWHRQHVEPLCRFCMEQGKLTPGDLVDHIIPVEVNPERFLDPTNYRTLCRDHHEELHGRKGKS